MSCLKLFSPVDDAPSSGFLSLFRGDDELPPDLLPFRREPRASFQPVGIGAIGAGGSRDERDRRRMNPIPAVGDVCIVRMLPPCPACREVSLDFTDTYPRLSVQDDTVPVCRCRRCDHEWVAETRA
jgi:hypothetical protein